MWGYDCGWWSEVHMAHERGELGEAGGKDGVEVGRARGVGGEMHLAADHYSYPRGRQQTSY